MEESGTDNLRSMEAELAELERVQIEILQRISNLEVLILGAEISQNLSISPNHHSAAVGTSTEDRLSALLRENGVKNFAFRRVPSDYYQWSFEARRDALGAASVNHLCKSIVLVNTQAPTNITDCTDRYNSKYYVVIVQYTARFSAEAVKNFLYTLNNGNIAKKKFNMRLAPEEISRSLTGYEHNAVTCIGMKTNIPTFTKIDLGCSCSNIGAEWPSRCVVFEAWFQGVSCSDSIPELQTVSLGYLVNLERPK